MAVPLRSEASWSSWRRKWKPDLKSQPWKNFKISGIAYIIKSHFTEADCSYEFCISDLKTVWYEKIDEKTFRNRSKKLNPNVEGKIGYLLKNVQANLEEQQMDTVYSLHQNSSSDGKEIMLHLETKLWAVVPFIWECHCTPDGQDLLAEHLIRPLFAMVTELGRRQVELQSLLRKKDLQIKDYKESGARLSRKNLETPEFDCDNFPTKMVLTKGFEESVEYNEERAFAGTGQELYRQIMIRKAWLDVRDSLQEPEQETGESFCEMSASEQVWEGEPPPEGVSSWTDRLPPSLVGTRSSPRKTPHSSPVKSDGRISSPEVSPSKEMELQRRAALERKLAEEAEQAEKSKKRRKINL